MKKYKPLLLWILAVLMGVLAALYQDETGPTNPIMDREIIEGSPIAYRLLRSHISHEPLPVALRVEDQSIRATLKHRRHKTDDPWTEVNLERKGSRLFATIPGQPMAGKVEYQIFIEKDGTSHPLVGGQTIVARFRRHVSWFILGPHIALMFLAFIFAIRTGLEALQKERNLSWLVKWTLAIVFLGGMILGPVVQKIAFDDLWTGFPFGYDLTDNKTLIVFIFWILAFFLYKRSRWWVIAAVVLMLAVYMIPHSVLGSELDYETGKMKQKYGHMVLPERQLIDLNHHSGRQLA